MIAALLFALNLMQLWRDTNSHAANARGVKAFERKQYANAVKDFKKAKQSSPAAAFNLGTAQIAAGDREQGSDMLTKAVADPRLRGDAFFNRGNSALAAKSWDYAIHDYTEALKANARDMAAKRNLEIAMAEKRAAQRPQAGGSNRGNRGPAQSPQPQPTAGQQRRGDSDADALLRSVQQQEQEELARMRRARPERAHVGW